jgi:hypothetical protein
MKTIETNDDIWYLLKNELDWHHFTVYEDIQSKEIPVDYPCWAVATFKKTGLSVPLFITVEEMKRFKNEM